MQGQYATIWQRIGVEWCFSRTAVRRLPAKRGPAAPATLLLFFVFVFATFFSFSWIDFSSFSATKGIKEDTIKHQRKFPKRIEMPLNCSTGNRTQTCPSNYSPTKFDDPSSNSMCPDYFRWIHEDLRPFKATGITRDMVERAKKVAKFRVVVVEGKMYVKKYRKSRQTRDVFTLWGILQLLRRYPGRLPNLDLMFDTDDHPMIPSSATAPSPLFRYCGDERSLDIVFPDWSFWGWVETNIKPWESLSKEMKEGNERIKWTEREPYAYWKGNPLVAKTRKNLMTCNVSEKQDWNARLFVQDWSLESQLGFQQSGLASQCTYRYKIYIEGSAWSVSEKYILACDSETLLVTPKYYDFFTRSLQPVHHYWPIRDDDKCRSIKFAVDWGNNHKQKAQAIGKAASDFIQEDLKMDYVYDYMFHLLNEYAKLLNFVPEVPGGAVEFCSETMACDAEGLAKEFMMETLEKGPSITNPCRLPPPYEPHDLGFFLERKTNSIKQVEEWERSYWESLDKKQ